MLKSTGQTVQSPLSAFLCAVNGVNVLSIFFPSGNLWTSLRRLDNREDVANNKVFLCRELDSEA